MVIPLSAGLVTSCMMLLPVAPHRPTLCLEIFFARQLLRNLWSPFILPFDCGLYGGE